MNSVRDRFAWRTAFKIAWRESRASSSRFLFVILAVALGSGALTGVRGFSESFRGMLVRDARKLMAADLTVRTFSLPDTAQEALFQTLESRGVDRTWVTESLSMLSAGQQGNPVLVSLKAVDPAVYPFYGEMKLDPPIALREALQPSTVAVSDDLLTRLDLKKGDSVRIGAADFRIMAVVAAEPDRMAGSLNVGPRILMSREGLDRTGLLVAGSRAAERFLFRLPPQGPGIEDIRARLKAAFPDAQIIDYRETHPLITRGLERSTIFLSLVSLIALLVGALGVAMAMHSHLQQKMDSIAVMKSLGARSSQIIRIYTLQTMMLGLMGGLLGICAGLIVQRIFPSLLARYFQTDPGLHWNLLSALQGLGAAVLTTLLFTVPPLLGIRRVRPSLILRREMEESRPDWKTRLRGGKSGLAVGVVIACGILGIVWWLSESWRTALYFAGGFAVSLLLLAAIAYGFLRGLKRISALAGMRLPSTLRHGVANIYRPGNQATALLVSLGLGVMFTLTVYLVQASTLRQMMSSAPPDMPNVFLINITPRERDGIRLLLEKEAGVKAEVTPVVAARITKVNGQPVQDMGLRGFARRFQQTRSLTWSAEPPPQTVITEGRFWSAKATAQTVGVRVCISEEVMKVLRIHPGAMLDWTANAIAFQSRVECVYHSEAVRIGANLEFLFIPGSLDALPALHFAAVRMPPAKVAPLQKSVFRQFPTVTVINGADVLAIVQEVVDRISLVVRFISLFTIMAGAVILSSSVAGTRFRRIREVVILKTLGATRRRIGGVFSVEFLLLGGVSGVMGSVLATAFTMLLLKRLFRVEYHFEILPHLVAIVLTAALANAAGWLASRRVLDQKPMDALREST
ncbi:MAG: FtsX-like permease family protein [Candidatus Solibacter usitatus]|nr:FtsX-like permease family protein [Candidatus Solibacter usitatus]